MLHVYVAIWPLLVLTALAIEGGAGHSAVGIPKIIILLCYYYYGYYCWCYDCDYHDYYCRLQL